jgi:pyruvate,orthophosphate dikinase
MGACCVAGAGSIKVDEKNKTMTVNGKVYSSDDYISLDGSAGDVYEGNIATVEPEISGHFGTFMSWADEIRSLKVRTNADTPHDAEQAIKFGAEGIGLTRTEHMFFAEDRVFIMRQMIVARTEEARRVALEKLLPMQKGDFKGIYKAMQGHPVTVRFLDPPLHEFLPTKEKEIADLASELKMSVEDLNNVISELHEFNPMMGHRGCRLSISYPEIAEMQTRAVIEAAIEVNEEMGWNTVPEIMIPLVGEVNELKYVKNIVKKTADAIIAEKGVELKYLVGTMIEIPRACVTADEIAKEADFFSFGTNDLTQMSFGFSRDDAGTFLKHYYDKKIYDFDPFAKLDQTGVGQFVKIAVEKGRGVKENLKLGVCGEHGGDPSSVHFFHENGLDYVSCSPFRVPVARLAAAQAQVKNPRK